MTGYTKAKLAKLIGPKIPTGAIPAAWWITTDPAQLAAYDSWKADYKAHADKIAALAESIGLKLEDSFHTSYDKTSILTGFRVPVGMKYWAGAPGHIAVPPGWRVDRKADRLVPSRRTRADRASEVNKAFAAVRRIPDVHAYLTGMPNQIYLDDRDFGGTIYHVQYRRGANCVMAFSGGDPDRSPDKKRFNNDEIDPKIWHRQKLSTLIALREDATVNG